MIRIDIKIGPRYVADAEMVKGRVHVTARLGPKKGQFLACVSDQTAAIAAVQRYKETFS